MGVGACATRLLADFGAEVIRIEDRNRLDMPRRLPIYKGEARTYGEEDANPDPNKGGLFNNYNRNKLGVTINMRSPKGRALANRLIASSSVVTENFAPGVMERWGLTYERLRELSPQVIFARMSGFGHSGPHAEFRSYGPVVQAVSGISHISGLPGQEPSGWGLSYMDNQAAFFNAAALLVAIYNRNLTGEGAEVDVSAVEAGISLARPGPVGRGGEWPLDPRTGLSDRQPARASQRRAAPGFIRASGPTAGSRSPSSTTPNGVACSRWPMSLPGPDDPHFATQAARFANQDALDDHLAAWTRDKDRHALMHALQVAGVAAAAVQTTEDTIDHDPQIASRGLFFELDHPVIGEALFEGTPIKFSRTVQENWRSAPLLGEDNEHVFKSLLGVSDDEYEALVAEGVL